MNNNIVKLKGEFVKISNMGWIKSDRNSPSGIGCTFERLLKVKSENFEISDYEGIEIKTRKAFSNSYIKLFNATPDGKHMFQVKRLNEKYGYPDSIIRTVKVFNISICANKSNQVGQYMFKLYVNRNEKKIYLNVYNKTSKLVDEETFWSFELLKEKLLRKLQLLAVVEALYKRNHNDDYYHYNCISFYKLKDFKTFIDLIEKGFIRVTFKVGVFRSGKRYKEMHDRGTGFEIREEDLKELYYVISI